MSRRRFAAEAQVICERTRASIGSLSSRYLAPGPITLTEIQGYAKDAGMEVRAGIAALGALVPPKREEKRVKALLRAAEREVSQLDRAATNEAEAKELLRGGASFADTRKLARRLRLLACSDVS